jgi:hypothetical protein
MSRFDNYSVPSIREGRRMTAGQAAMLEQKELPPADVDHIYFDLTYYNNSTSIQANEQTIPATVFQSYAQTIIKNPEEWSLTVARFSISSNNIPRVVQSPTTTDVTTEFWVGVSYAGNYYDAPILLPAVLYNNQIQLRAAFNVNQFLDLINTGYIAAQTLAAAAGGPTGAGYPFMSYDPVSGLYQMNEPDYMITNGTGTSNLTMSYQLYHKFQSFPVHINAPLTYNHHDVSFYAKVRGNGPVEYTYPDLGTTGLYIPITQEAAWPSSIMDINRLLVTTTTIPVVTEFRGTQTYMSLQANNQNETKQIITDFFIGLDQQILPRSEHWLYTPNLYRIASMKGNTPMRQLDITIYVVTTAGIIYQLYLNPLDSLDIKLLFMKKGLTA